MGKYVTTMLNLPFYDSNQEIEKAAHNDKFRIF
ncbi:hypothetical protein [Bartonella sp. JB63]